MLSSEAIAAFDYPKFASVLLHLDPVPCVLDMPAASGCQSEGRPVLGATSCPDDVLRARRHMAHRHSVLGAVIRTLSPPGPGHYSFPRLSSPTNSSRLR